MKLFDIVYNMFTNKEKQETESIISINRFQELLKEHNKRYDKLYTTKDINLSNLGTYGVNADFPTEITNQDIGNSFDILMERRGYLDKDEVKYVIVHPDQIDGMTVSMKIIHKPSEIIHQKEIGYFRSTRFIVSDKIEKMERQSENGSTVYRSLCYITNEKNFVNVKKDYKSLLFLDVT